jgi:putative phage-type endonuclease
LFDIVDLEQGSDEWRLWRRGGIGASDAPTIMGENRWKSADDLQFERMNPNSAENLNSAMARGTRLEPVARARYVTQTKIAVQPLCIQSKERPWMRCSLDGISIKDRRIVEIKCGKSSYRHTARNRSPPTYYYGQLQHILSVTGYETIGILRV